MVISTIEQKIQLFKMRLKWSNSPRPSNLEQLELNFLVAFQIALVASTVPPTALRNVTRIPVSAEVATISIKATSAKLLEETSVGKLKSNEIKISRLKVND